MNTTVTTKPCFYCYHPVDLDNDDFVIFEALHNMQRIFGDDPKVAAHTLCAAKADKEFDLERDYSDYLDANFPLQYEVIQDEYR